MKRVVAYHDDDTKKYFEIFCQKVQQLFSQYPRSRHVVFTPVDVRMMYILFLCKMHETYLFKNHQCHFCIIYDKENIISMDINTRFCSHDVVKSFMKHAETNAILQLVKSNVAPIQSLGIFITRFSKTSLLNDSRPCFFCARFIKKHLSYFHSICFTDQNEQLVVMTPEEFKNTEFSHKTQRFRHNLFS